MSTTLTRPAAEAGRSASKLRLEPAGHRRRPALAVGSLALVVACVAVFVSVYLKAGHQESVLAVARLVPQGQVLRADDLTVVRVSTNSGIATVPSAEASSVVGRRAAESLAPETLLAGNELVTSYSPPAGESIVGVAVKEGQLPASGVAPGETVAVVLTGLPGEQDSSSVTPDSTPDQESSDPASAAVGAQSGASGTVLVPDATVLETISSPSSSGSDSVDVSLLTPSALAPLVADASAAGQVALIVVTQPGS